MVQQGRLQSGSAGTVVAAVQHTAVLVVQCHRKAGEYLDDKQIEEDMEVQAHQTLYGTDAFLQVPIDRYLLAKDLQELLQERVKTFNNMAQVPGTKHNGSLYYKTLGSHSTVNSLVNFSLLQAQMKLTAWDASMASIRQVREEVPSLKYF